MKLPLGQQEEAEILAAYGKALTAASECAASLEAFSKLLDQRIACIDDESYAAISSKLTTIDASQFKIRMSTYKVKQANFEGRQLKACQIANQQELF